MKVCGYSALFDTGTKAADYSLDIFHVAWNLQQCMTYLRLDLQNIYRTV
jgi:hypothetical protein